MRCHGGVSYILLDASGFVFFTYPSPKSRFQVESTSQKILVPEPIRMDSAMFNTLDTYFEVVYGSLKEAYTVRRYWVKIVWQ
ncbi:hypothetical protein EYC84_011904 [Monilinia fructicola]|uniref:Uncharacterized protein n=1 Tax=Monilinia fructicola TaxID=38448 RepID=A0A5M9J6P8_MONFR|nr:hypothetical protein EYC84_011904 [Monilinia fructicola]